MKIITKFHENIMELLRVQRGLDRKDISKDGLINQYSINEAYKNLLMFGNYSQFNVEISPEYLDKVYRINTN